MLGPEGLGRAAEGLGLGGDALSNGAIPEAVFEVWSDLPGLLAGIFMGMGLLHWARSRDFLTVPSGGDDEAGDAEDAEHTRGAKAAHAGSGSRASPGNGDIVDRLSIQLGFLALAIAIGWLMLEGLVLVEDLLWGGEEGLEFFVHVPLFPFALGARSFCRSPCPVWATSICSTPA